MPLQATDDDRAAQQPRLDAARVFADCRQLYGSERQRRDMRGLLSTRSCAS